MADGAVCVPTPRSEASPPPPSCLCVYTPLRHVCGAGTADRSVVGPRVGRDSRGDRYSPLVIPVGLVVLCACRCASVRVTWSGGRVVLGPGIP